MLKINAQPTTPEDRDLLGDRVRLRGELALLGWPSLRAWAAHHGHDATAVSHALRTWGRRTDGRRPHGQNSSAIISGLISTIRCGQRYPMGGAQ